MDGVYIKANRPIEVFDGMKKEVLKNPFIEIVEQPVAPKRRSPAKPKEPEGSAETSDE